MMREQFPFLALTSIAVPMATGDGALAIVMAAALIAMLPLAYSEDVDAIVESTFARDD